MAIQSAEEFAAALQVDIAKRNLPRDLITAAINARDAAIRAETADVSAWRALPGYPWLPCPICKGVEGCDHTVPERARASSAATQPEPAKIRRCAICGLPEDDWKVEGCTSGYEHRP